jgi:hypothetical protein
MATPVQVTMDAHDPLSQARFWAAALGYDVEDNTALIRGVLDAGHAGPDDVMEVDGQLYWRDLVAARDPEGAGPRLLFQRSERPKADKNRLHLDVNVGGERRQAEVERLQALGARVLYEVDEPGGRHTTMADPEGNEFCVQ